MARPLTEVRDAKILIETTDKLAEHFKDKVSGRTFAALRKELQPHARSTRKRVLSHEHAFPKIRKMLRQLKRQVKDWSDVPNKWSSVGNGLADTFGNASDAFSDAANDPQPEKLHEWRKQVKYLRYQLILLEPLWPERLNEIAGEADTMGALLGDDHDLTLLGQMLTAGEEPIGDPGDSELLLALIEHRQKQLREQATLLAKRFLEERPADFAPDEGLLADLARGE